MKVHFKRHTIFFLNILLPLTALVVLGVSLFLWFTVFRGPSKREQHIEHKHLMPETFSERVHDHIVTVLSEYGISDKNVTYAKKDSTIIGNYYLLKIPENISLTILNLKLSLMVHHLGGTVFEGIEDTKESTLTLTIGVGTTKTDVIILKKFRDYKAQIAKVALIIDDLGIRNPASAQWFCECNQIVTLSILPFKPYTADIVKIARATNIPYMLHMPMEPKSKTMDAGREAILVGDSRSIIERKLSRAFKSVRGAEGLNNHMGSKATENTFTMEIVMGFLRANNLFFVDSRTSNETKGYSISRQVGVKGAIIDGYIDAVNDLYSIENKCDKLAELALQKGTLIIIGHDRPLTLEVLKRKLPEFEEKGITFVPVSDLID
jgi:uncharacterized protein